jgi:CDP-diacylglycerol---glycerol-3-phosphate 3-phosphatidyltransferase
MAPLSKRFTGLGLRLSRLGLATAVALLVVFENHERLFFYWLGGVVFLGGSALSLLSDAAEPGGNRDDFGAVLDSLVNQISESLVLAAIAIVFARRREEIALAFTVASVVGLLLVRYASAWASLVDLDLRVATGGALWAIPIAGGLIGAPWDALPWVVSLLAVAAWSVVGCYVVTVRRRLQAR